MRPSCASNANDVASGVRSIFLPAVEPRAYVLMRRFAIVTAIAYAVLFSWGIYRRLVQVQCIEITAAPAVIRPGAEIGYDVITSGEVHNLIRLELVQGPRSVVIDERWSDVNRVNTLDPRLFRYRPTIRVDGAALSEFGSGPATLRLTVFGNRKLLRVPKSRAREREVTIAGEDVRRASP